MMKATRIALSAFVALASALDIKVASGGGNATSPLQYGLMFEDINYSGDGGIYAELIRNRAFQGHGPFPSDLTGWSSFGGTTLSLKNLTDPVSGALPTSMNVAVPSSGSKVGFANTGWWGIDVQIQPYAGSFWVKGSYNGTFVASLQSDINNQTFGTAEIQSKPSSDAWTEYNYTLTPTSAASNSNNSFVLTFDAAGVSDGSLDFQLISLFPPTFKNRANGLRKDIAEALYELNPKFLRLPGGNNIEGNDPPYHWKWNETIGPLINRPGRPGTWGYENTDGLGLVEYMHWCQDLEMEPILAVWAGFYLNGVVISNETLGIYVQDTLNELEFLMGSSDTTYGALRISLGYPEPFPIKYVEVGNEDFLDKANASYSAYRYQRYYYAIKEAYPDMTIIASTVAVDPLPGNSNVDYHEYSRPDDFVSEFNYFDHFSRDHPVLIGEYAIVQPNLPGKKDVNWDDPKFPFPIWQGTVSEAVFLIGAERNSDVILGSSFAPALQNLNEYQWTPDMISYTADPSQDVLSTSWHMLKLMGNNLITHTLPTTGADFGPAYWVAGINNQTGSHILKTAVYNSTGDVPMTVSFDGVKAGASANLTILTAPDGFAYNSVGSDIVKSVSTTITASANGTFSFSLPNLSVSVLVVESGEGSSSAQNLGKRGWDMEKMALPRGYKQVTF